MLTMQKTTTGRKQSFFLTDEDNRIIFEATATEWVGPIDISVFSGGKKTCSLSFSVDVTPVQPVFCHNIDIFDDAYNFVGSIRTMASGLLFRRKYIELKIRDGKYKIQKTEKDLYEMQYEEQPCAKTHLRKNGSATLECPSELSLYAFIFCIAVFFRNPVID